MSRQADKNLLIIDDDAIFARTLSRSFNRRGYRVQLAGSLKEFDRLLQSGCTSHAVIDLNLPDGSGLDCIEALHARDPAAKVVVLTGNPSLASAIRAIRLGATHYLCKPSTTDEIEAAFERSCGDPDVPVESPVKALSAGFL